MPYRSDSMYKKQDNGNKQPRFGVIRIKRVSGSGVLQFLLTFFCMAPFLFPIPEIGSNMQPHALAIGMLIILAYLPSTLNTIRNNSLLFLLLITTIISTTVFVMSGISPHSFRGYFNHLSLFIIPTATLVLAYKNGFAEKNIKRMILLWFVVSLIQMFVYRGFLAFMIGSPAWSSSYRGVIGLASEPSFYGIACFYFLHLALRFEKNARWYLLLITFMGMVLAQSTMGILFIAAFWFGYWFDNIGSKRGFGILILTVVIIVIGVYALTEYGSNTRLFAIVSIFLDGGTSVLLESDQSAYNRFYAIVNAITSAWEVDFLPQGYGNRIGSGYGGFLSELGFFAFIEIFALSLGIAQIYRKKRSRVLYFFLITILLFSNTQIGNPQLLMILGYNLYFSASQRSYA